MPTGEAGAGGDGKVVYPWTKFTPADTASTDGAAPTIVLCANWHADMTKVAELLCSEMGATVWMYDGCMNPLVQSGVTGAAFEPTNAKLALAFEQFMDKEVPGGADLVYAWCRPARCVGAPLLGVCVPPSKCSPAVRAFPWGRPATGGA